MSRHFVAVVIAGLFASGTAMAQSQSMSREAYKTEKDRVEAEYKAARDRCAGLSGNAKDVCTVEVKGNEKVALAALDARRSGTEKAMHDARVARIDADYELAKERCDDLAGNAKDVCQKQAKSTHTRAMGDARVARKSNEVRSDAAEQTRDVRRDANQDTREAEYRLARERCDSLAGEAKNNCLAEARTRFGRS